MLVVDLRTLVVLILSAFLLAVCGFILVVDRVAQAEKKRRQGKKEDRRNDL